MGQRTIACRIDDVEAGPDHGDARGPSGNAAAVGCGVDTERQSADDGDAGVAQRAGEILGVCHALCRCIAAADNGDRKPVEQRAVALHVEQRRRIRDLQQKLRIGFVAERDDMVCGVRQPAESAARRRLISTGGDRRGNLGAYVTLQLKAAGCEDLLWRAAGSEQLTDRRAAEAIDQRQAQPGFAGLRVSRLHGRLSSSNARRPPTARRG